MEENLKVNENSVVIKINPKLYPLETVYSAAYVFLDKAYVLLDGDPKKEILVELKPKQKQDLKTLGGEFFNELINYADYQKRAEHTKKTRETILQRALITNDPSILQNNIANDEFDNLPEDLEDNDYLEDPEGIAIPWEEKYGDNVKKKSKNIKKDEDKTEQ